MSSWMMSPKSTSYVTGNHPCENFTDCKLLMCITWEIYQRN